MQFYVNSLWRSRTAVSRDQVLINGPVFYMCIPSKRFGYSPMVGWTLLAIIIVLFSNCQRHFSHFERPLNKWIVVILRELRENVNFKCHYNNRQLFSSFLILYFFFFVLDKTIVWQRLIKDGSTEFRQRSSLLNSKMVIYYCMDHDDIKMWRFLNTYGLSLFCEQFHSDRFTNTPSSITLNLLNGDFKVLSWVVDSLQLNLSIIDWYRCPEVRFSGLCPVVIFLQTNGMMFVKFSNTCFFSSMPTLVKLSSVTGNVS